jgi:hypothetical protein
MMNVFGTCWFIAITMTFFFSDTTRYESQNNLLQMIIKLKENNLSDNQHQLLKIIYKEKDYYENEKLKIQYINIHRFYFQLIQKYL